MPPFRILKRIFNFLCVFKLTHFCKYGHPYRALSKNKSGNYSKFNFGNFLTFSQLLSKADYMKPKYLKFDKILHYLEYFLNFKNYWVARKLYKKGIPIVFVK